MSAKIKQLKQDLSLSGDKIHELKVEVEAERHTRQQTKELSDA